jgi:hypothetical protein
MYKVIGKHGVLKSVDGKSDIVISEMYDPGDDNKPRRFVATICGFRNWRLVQCNENLLSTQALELAIRKSRTIRDRILTNDNSVFTAQQAW